jgi:hypothetical protein
MTNSFNSYVSMQSILIRIGFDSNGDEFHFKFTNGKVKAIKGFNRIFQEGFHFLGYYFTERKAGEIDYFLPFHVESFEQGLAFIAYPLRNADLKNKPDWLIEGLTLKEHLPWEKEMKAYNENPVAYIEHEWFRVLLNKLKLLISTSTDENLTTFSFDGGILKVVCNNETLVVGGLGKNWHQEAIVKTKLLDFLPKRVLKRNVPVYIWRGNLHIHNRCFKLEE